MNKHMSTHRLIAAGLSAVLVGFAAGAQDAPPNPAPAEPAAQSNSGDEPSLDDLLGTTGDEPMPDRPAGEGDAGNPAGQPSEGADEADPELTRELDRRLTGQEASEQFAQAIQEMDEVAILLGEESDPGIDTQRKQDQIILKLEQIIASAQKVQNQQQQQQQGQQQQQQQARQADRGSQQQPQQQPGQEPGQQQDGQQQQQANQPGDQQQGDQQGEQPGQQQQAGDPQNNSANPSGGPTSRGSVRNQELTMQELREGEWGNLPPRLRDELAESLSETFNPVYRAATEAFYRRLAELSQQQAEQE